MSTIDNVTAKISKSKRWMILSRAKRMLDYFNYHNENLNAGQWHAVITLEDGIDDEDLELIRDSVEFLYTHSVKLTKEQWYYVSDMYMDFFSSDGEFYEPGYVSDVNSSRKIGKKRPVKASVDSSSYDTKLIAKYVKETYDDSASARIRSFGHMSNAERYMDRNGLIYDSKNKLILFRDWDTKETTPIFKVIPQHSNIKKYGMYAPKEPILEPVDSCDSVMSSYSDSRKIRRGRKVLSAIDPRRKQDFVDAYMAAYGVTKTEAFKAFTDCVNRGDESYIDEIIRWFKGNSRKSFYED